MDAAQVTAWIGAYERAWRTAGTGALVCDRSQPFATSYSVPGQRARECVMAVRPLRKRSTIRDVARSAQVSHQTVSRVINGEKSVRPDTRLIVDAAIQPCTAAW